MTSLLCLIYTDPNVVVPVLADVLAPSGARSTTDTMLPLQWRHNGRDGVSNHQPHDCLLNRVNRRRSKWNVKAPRRWPLWGEVSGDRRIPRANGQKRRKYFNLMTLSWNTKYDNEFFQVPQFLKISDLVSLIMLCTKCWAKLRGTSTCKTDHFTIPLYYCIT